MCLLGGSATAWAQAERTESVEVRDGTRLATDVYLPAGTGPFPVILIRTPYNKGGSAAFSRAVTGNAAAAVVVQDTRGKYASQGIDCVFRCELGEGLGDGEDTMAWINAQDFSNGTIVTIGASALGIVQYMQAVRQPPGLTAMFVEVGTPTLYTHGMYQGGVFRQALAEGWLRGNGSEFFLDKVADHPFEDEFWAPVQTTLRFGEVNVPAVHWGGWYDIFAQGTLDAFVGYQHEGGPNARGKQKLVMGPWVHGNWGQGKVQQGELRYPEVSSLPELTPGLLVTWLVHYLGLTPDQAAIDAIPAVQYYVMGDVDDPRAPGNEWRSAPDWPIPAAGIRWHLQAEGKLSEACPPVLGPQSNYTYDPASPVLTIGGANLGIPAGPMDQRPAEAQSGIVVFDSGPLAAPVEITGRVRAHLFVSTDVVDTDVMVRLSDVYPDGRSMLVLDGAARLGARGATDGLRPLARGELVEVDVDLWSTSIVLAAGHHLRVSISSSNAPRFWPNPNNGSTYPGSGAAVVAEVSIHHTRARASYIELPDPSRNPGDVEICRAPTMDAGLSRDAGLTVPDAGDSGIDAGVLAVPGARPGLADVDEGCGCTAHPAPCEGFGLSMFGLLIICLRLRRR